MSIALKENRVHFIDEFRGVLFIGIFLYHLGYDFAIFGDFQMDWFWGSYISTVRYILAGSFMFISGISCSLSRNNLKRGVKILLVAIVLSITTAIIMPEQMILFGILHYFGVMIILFSLLKVLLGKVNSILGGTFCVVFFYITYNIPYGYIKILWRKFIMPDFLYNTNFLFWLGLPGKNFSSSDYYPILPWGLLLIAGGIVGIHFKKNGFPNFLLKQRVRFLSTIGKNTMILYIIHQPLILLTLNFTLLQNRIF